ncbi:hypothetical protein BDP27DRAFT_1413953 [Rhodocollybia butyracea]|uniref:Uncharacterized protein n=1 Tax=Rhodocollybia butyracea TaxID=206335 RepID=A0A9P5Q8N6_9AGAR|nr:hypothetical protein BDP27DRAFT_1413953 [Rhodocollybia butyracea]
MSSELSDALNPYYTQPRNSHVSNYDYAEHLQPVIQSSSQHVPHRSELELAFSEPQYVPVYQPQQSHGAMQELLRVVQQTNQAHENERKRRMAWEQEQEERYTQRQAELERQMMEMRQELYSLRSAFGASHTSPQAHSPASHNPVTQYHSPVSDSFVQGSYSQHYAPDPSTYQSPRYDSSALSPPPPPSSLSPSVSPLLRPENVSSGMVTPESVSESRGSNRKDDSTETLPKAPTPYQKKCRNINEAIRRHILRLMHIEGTQNLPGNHPEGAPYDPSHPLRFIWHKTTKQSSHNMYMKTFVTQDIKSNRQLYSELPDSDFNPSVLESAFEQVFTTLRQAYKVQHDAKEAETAKSKGDQKARHARRFARRKTKLTSRTTARAKIPIFQHAGFDGALQMDCMSSEETDDEADASQPKFVYTRGYLWRSNRLLRFLHTLDQEDLALPGKRTATKMDRAIGTPKESIGLPPKGVASWMVSRRWIRTTKAEQRDLTETLKDLINDTSTLPSETLYQLGEESDDEEEQVDSHNLEQLPVSQHYSSSLQNALA